MLRHSAPTLTHLVEHSTFRVHGMNFNLTLTYKSAFHAAQDIHIQVHFFVVVLFCFCHFEDRITDRGKISLLCEKKNKLFSWCLAFIIIIEEANLGF